MAHQFEITGAKGDRRRVPIGPDGGTIGSGAEATVCIAAAGIAPVELRIVPIDGGMRVEPVRPGALVAVNDEHLFCKDLAHGDEIELKGHHLRWIADPTAVAAATVTAAPMKSGGGRGKAARAHPVRTESRLPRRQRGVPMTVQVLLVIALVLIVAVMVLRRLRESTWPSSPQDYIELAKSQLANQQAERALETLSFVLGDATGESRQQALALQEEIHRMLVGLGEAPKVLAARQDHDLLLGFVDRYLRAGVTRPAAREFVHECDEWLQQHRELCARNADGQPLLAEVEKQRASFAAAAELDTPETAADVSFAASTRLRFVVRDYRGAMARFDAFLGQHPDAADVKAERDRCVADGEKWLRGRLDLLQQLVNRGDKAGAERDLRQLEKWAALPEWAPFVAAARQRIAAAH